MIFLGGMIKSRFSCHLKNNIMNNNSNRVALNMSKSSVPQKINKSRYIIDSISNNPGTFTNPSPSIATVSTAINNLELAWNEAADGSKSKIALMHDKERDLMVLMYAVAAYVAVVANGDAEIVHLAGLRYKKSPERKQEDFEVFLPDDRGAVGLKCNARKKTLYRWEYCKDGAISRTWTTAHTSDTSSAFVGNLDSNVLYWFRVVLMNKNGEHALEPKCIAPL